MTELSNETVEAAEKVDNKVEQAKPTNKPVKPEKKKGGFFGLLIKLLLLAILIGVGFYLYMVSQGEGGFSGLLNKGKQLVGMEPAVEEVVVEPESGLEMVESESVMTSESDEIAIEALDGESVVMIESDVVEPEVVELEAVEPVIDSPEEIMAAELTEVESEFEGFDVEAQFEMLKQEQQSLLASVQEALSSSTKELKLREAASLVKLANQANLLNKDALSAMSLLEAADDALIEVQGVNVTEARQLLSEAALELKAASKIDTEGMFLKLDSASKAIADLPMQPQYAIEPEESLAADASWTERFMYTFKEAFQVRKVSESVKPLLAADQMAQVKQNFSLSMAQAKLALMQQQPSVFSSSIETAAAVVEDFLDTENPVVQSVAETLSGLSSESILPEKVDLSEVVAAVSGLQAKQPPQIIISSPASATEE